MNIELDKRYVCIITSEKDKKSLGINYYAEHPEAGKFERILIGDDADEILGSSGDAEGLFYQLYSCLDGKKIGYGIFDYDSIKDDICFYQSRFVFKCEVIAIYNENGIKITIPWSLLREYDCINYEDIVMTEKEMQDIRRYLKNYVSEEVSNKCYICQSVKNLMYNRR